MNGTLQEQLEAIEDKIELKAGKYSIADLKSLIADKSKAIAESTDQCVHDRPWQSIGVALVGGLALGVLLRRL